MQMTMTVATPTIPPITPPAIAPPKHVYTSLICIICSHSIGTHKYTVHSNPVIIQYACISHMYINITHVLS